MSKAIEVNGLSLDDPNVNYLLLEEDVGFHVHGYKRKADVVNAVRYFWATSPEKKMMNFEEFSSKFNVFRTTQSFKLQPKVEVNFRF